MENVKHSENYYKNALSLAYLGDSVFSVEVRELLVKTKDIKPNALNKIANMVVCAKGQAEIMKQLKSELVEDEMDVVMRARNSHPNNKAKNSTYEEYCLATQLEALFGYWYLDGKMDKIKQVIKRYVVDKL